MRLLALVVGYIWTCRRLTIIVVQQVFRPTNPQQAEVMMEFEHCGVGHCMEARLCVTNWRRSSVELSWQHLPRSTMWRRLVACSDRTERCCIYSASASVVSDFKMLEINWFTLLMRSLTCQLVKDVVIPAKAFARDYGITGVRLSVCLFVCYHDN